MSDNKEMLTTAQNTPAATTDANITAAKKHHDTEY